MKFLYADTNNGVIESSKKIKASDIVDEEFLDNVDFYDDEELFFDVLSICEDDDILACNCVSNKMYKKIKEIFGIHS